MKKSLITAIAALFISMSLSAQDSGLITEILESSKLTFGQAAYITGVSNGSVAETDSYSKAFDTLSSNGLIKKGVVASDPITLADYTLMCARVTNLKGGLFYTLFSNSRYALREFKAQGLLPANADPDFTINGHEALSLISNCLELTETGEAE